MFSSSFDSTDVPVKSGLDGCVGWSGVLGSESCDGESAVVFDLFDGALEIGLCGGLFRIDKVEPEDGKDVD